MKNIKKIKDDLGLTLEKILKHNPTFQEGLDEAGEAWDIAFQIYNLRKNAGLTQTELAKLVHTRQANIARIESAEYTGYTLRTLEKVTKALKARLEIKIIPLRNTTPSNTKSKHLTPPTN